MKNIKHILLKIRSICLLLILIFVGLNLLINKKKEIKIKEIKETAIRTQIDNIFILKDEYKQSFTLVTIQNNAIKKISKLIQIGEIIPNKPILASQSSGYGAISPQGNIIVPFIYQEIHSGKNDRFILKDNNQYLLSDLKTLKKLDIDSVYQISDENLIFLKENKFGIINFNGEIIIPNEYNEISQFIKKIFIGEKNLKYSLYDLKNNKLTIDFDYIEQIGDNEYRGGSNVIGKFAFLSDKIITNEKYINLDKVDEHIFIGKINEHIFEIINSKTFEIIQVEEKELKSYLEKLKKEKCNE